MVFVPKAAERSSLRVSSGDLETYLVEDRRATISPWGRGNSKIGPNVFTYSRLPGRVGGTCPGSSPECEMICYAKRVVTGSPPVWALWTRNTLREDDVPPLPEGAEIVRFHISGDFDSLRYIVNWCRLVNRRPEVRFFGYTRSWRVPELVPWLERLRDYPNVQLFASMDKTIDELPSKGWRIAWLETDPRARAYGEISDRNFRAVERGRGPESVLVCPEETGDKKNCVECRYCIAGQRGDVLFLEH